MSCIKIKQLDHRTGAAGVHMGGGPERRKLEPGEVVDIPEDEMANSKEKLIDVLYATGRVELTLELSNRPLDYRTEREAKITSGTFKTRGAHEEAEREQAFADVSARMAEINSVSVETESPADIPQSPTPEPEQTAPPPAPRNRRAQRRSAAAGAIADAGIPQTS